MLTEKMKSRNKFILCVLACNAFFLLICLLFFHPHFETNDDYALLSIASGSFGEPSEYMVFINVLIGRLLSGLFRAVPGFNWYTLFMYLVTFVSVCAISLVLVQKKRRISYLLGLAFLLFYAYDCYVNMQFTKVSGIATLAGMLIIRYTYVSKRHWAFYIFGGIWVILGSMIRFSSFVMVLCVLAVFLAVDLIRGYLSAKVKKEFLFRSGILLGVLILVCGAAIGLQKYNNACYYKQADWSFYKAYSKSRVKLTDYPYPSYEENKEMYDRLGVTENDVYLYSHWTFFDPDIYTIDMMDQILTAQKNVGVSDIAEDIVWRVFPGYFSYSVLRPLLVVILAVFLLENRKRKWLAALAVADLVVLNCYMSFLQRNLQYRVDLLLIMTIFIFQALALTENEELKNVSIKNRLMAFLAGVLVVANCSAFATDLYNKKAKLSKEKKQEYIEAYETVYEDTEHLYFAVTPCSMRFAIYEMFDVVPRGQCSNLLSLGGWTVMMPDELAIMDKYGISNPFRDTVGNKDVYFISNDAYMQRILTYVQDHYYPDAKLKACRKLGDLFVYKIVR